ncbi:PTS ascorbate transporter subunit IIC, partial [Streptomyces nanshensis]
LFGVRTVLGELVPAFQGIAHKAVPGAVPALDAPIVFPYAQNAVLVGFLASFTGGLCTLGLLAWLLSPAFGLALVLPGLVPHFFTGGAAGVYGNATGGRRGAALGAFCNGVLITLLPAVLLKVLGTFGAENTTFGDADFGWFGTLIGYAGRAGRPVGIALMLAVGAVLLAGAVLVQKRVAAATGTEAAPPGAARIPPPGPAGDTAPRRFPKLPPPAGAPVPPPPPD